MAHSKAVEALRHIQGSCEAADFALREGDTIAAKELMAAVIERLKAFENWGTQEQREQALMEAFGE